MARETDNYWFAGHRDGCGTGPAITWQGWLLSAIYGLVIAAAAIGLAERTVLGFVAIVIVATAVLLAICHAKTPGGLHLCLPPGMGGKRRGRR
jgi:hypothetical protein